MRRAVVGIAAHVDAGKTTLCEALLYRSGEIRKLGRVDHGDAFLDTDAMEKRRGITIFSKQAILQTDNVAFTILDTPGHVDFSAEMERTLRVIDYAILVVGANDGLQGYTETLWRILERYNVPTFIFINKMDVTGADKESLLSLIRHRFSEGCVDADNIDGLDRDEQVALLDDTGIAVNQLLDDGRIQDQTLRRLVNERRLFPCFSGSALKLKGVDEFLAGLERFTSARQYPQDFGARVYKISHDNQGNRLTWLKVTGGSLAVKDSLSNIRLPEDPDEGSSPVGTYDARTGADTPWSEKIDQIRRYSASKYELIDTVEAGEVCAVTGLTRTFPGEGLGFEDDADAAVLQPVLTYTVWPGADDDNRLQSVEAVNSVETARDSAADHVGTRDAHLPSGSHDRTAPIKDGAGHLAPEVQAAEVTPELHHIFTALRTLEDEDPNLGVRWVPRLGQIQIQLMGAVQQEVIVQMLHDRFGMDVHCGSGGILYRETISASGEGIGHFEPLRHYAEVHLLLEPGQPGSGMRFRSKCSLDDLDRNWQRAILSHLAEKEHLGVLTASPITDMRISLIAGRGHDKHTEGGDFREATYRAVRQGLMELKRRGACQLLEPWYRFRLEVPQETMGRAISDIQRMSGTFDTPMYDGEYAVIEGRAPVSQMRDYSNEVNAYARGRGQLNCVFDGYRPCHDAQTVIDRMAYDPETDMENTPDSVFCAHGVGYTVKWNKVPDFAHVTAKTDNGH
ncbi:small GTP-binding protein domain-containing protein [Bifidobacterium bohemicum]|uniref:Translation elongation factor n=1 Tax=Bifidobacterium bohemicum DSM 22767 TaxID=1437606 RepID=A0A086ZJC4_9BIFI|nr:TetM/TetW/TetO/TetS family tetracycline resistance ribosomal protection protein [Bifidobacterium bohemicum]KFI46624.1 translation elongation factor [Bifidobacterium bohemicum DSM 22767]SCB77080.1 small GTP-binding protein domain-containing protein [Bifidobacterium bohemicum]